MRNARSIPIPLVRQQAVQEVRAMCRVSLCSSSSSLLFIGFLLLLWVAHRPQPCGSRRTERANYLPWHGSAMGPSTFGAIPSMAWSTSFQCVSSAVPSNVSSDASPLLLLVSPLFLPQCIWAEAPCTLLVEILVRSGLFPSVWEPSSTGYNWLGNSWPPPALVTPTALWQQNPAVYTWYTSKCGFTNNLNGS